MSIRTFALRAAALTLLAAHTGAQANWTFERTQDPVTGAVTCQALSPADHMLTGAGTELAPVRLVISVTGARVSTAMRVDTPRAGLFHTDFSGAGVKVEPGAFHAASPRSTQKMTGFVNGSALVDELLLGKSFRMRVRFWPYDQVVDSRPITTEGMPAAVLKASKCA